MLFGRTRYRLKGRLDLPDRFFDIVGIDNSPLGVALNGDIFEGGGNSGAPILTVRHPFKLLGDKVTIKQGGRMLGSFRFSSLRDEPFQFVDADGFEVATITATLRRSHFQVVAVDGARLGEIIHEWEGFVNAAIGGPHMYEVSIAPAGTERAGSDALLLGTALAIDIAYPRED